MNHTKQRESQIELLRLFSQFLIILSHILLFTHYPRPLYQWIWPFLHIGVPVFIMISGYFTIKASISGFVKLLGYMAVLSIPLGLLNCAITGGDFIDYIKVLLFVSNTPFWFMRTYMLLYLLSPMMNKYLESLSNAKYFALFVTLFFFSDYVGSLNSDPSIYGGKNIITFMMYYTLGYGIKRYTEYINTLKTSVLITIFIIINIFIIGLMTIFNESPFIIKCVLQLCYQYYGPILLVNATLLFILINRFTFYSHFINSIAKASLVIFMLHSSAFILYNIIIPINIFIEKNTDQISFFFFEILFSIIIMFFCIIINSWLTPIWNLLSKTGEYIENKTKNIYVW